jgi:hypothetical protein
MQPGEYRRLHATCLHMAEQANSPDERARWLVLAKDCEGLLEGSSVKKGRSKSLSTRLSTWPAVNWRAA